MTQGELILLTVAAGAIGFGLTPITLIIMVQLQRHRIDLDDRATFTSGDSPLWQLNTLDADNYSPPGKRLLRWLNLLLVLQLGAIVILVATFPRLFQQ